MRKGIKTILAGTLALCFAVPAFVGCSSGTALEGDFSGEVSSNGGFVVEKGNYYYFINGKQEYTASNEFGSVVKGSLMRIAKSALSGGAYGEAEIVVPSLMVAGDYSSGIYIYGDRVYYATPTTAKNQSGSVENSFLDFKSTKLDGTDTSDLYFRLEDNTVKYRFVEENGVVYCMYVEDSDIYSFNTADKKSTMLVQDAGSYLFSADVEKPGVYYTMPVQVDIDKPSNYTDKYTQIYYVSASVTEAPYSYEYDKDYLSDYRKENGKDAMPYVNLGTIVLDGRGSDSAFTQYNHNEGTTAYTPSGYTYSLVAYANDGLYYTRSYVDTTSSTGDGGWLFYLSDENARSTSWNAVSGNADTSLFGAGEYNDIIAYDTTKASSSALFLKEEGTHSYLYVENNAIFRNDVKEIQNGIEVKSTRIADSVSSATLLYTETSGEFGYVYYSEAGTNGKALGRAVYNGEEGDYNALLANSDYQPVKIAPIDYASDWYAPEKLGDYLFFSNAEALQETSYNYICVMDLKGTNKDIASLNEKFEEITTEITDVRAKYSALGNLMLYHYWTAADNPVFNRYYLDQGMSGKTMYENTDYFNASLKEAEEEGYTDTYLYSAYFKDTFRAFREGTGEYQDKFVDETGKSYAVQSYFYHWIGRVTDDDMEAIDKVCQDSLVLSVTVDETEEGGLPVWAIVLIVVGSVLVAAGIAAAIAIPLVLRSKKKGQAEKPKAEKLAVDTTDDENIDVYADDDSEAVGEPEEAPEQDVPASEEKE